VTASTAKKRSDIISSSANSHTELTTGHSQLGRLARRRAAWRPYGHEVPHGFMRRYRRHGRPACDGAVLD
jgi:hypothetical protein